MTRYQTKQGDVLDEIIWRVHGIVDLGIVEATLEANRGLADYGPTFPAGIVIEIPDRPGPVTQQALTLWT